VDRRSGGIDDMTEREKQLRRRDRIRMGVILALCLILAVPVVVVMAASPDPSASTAASESPASQAPSATTEAPAATIAPAAPLAPEATKAPSVQRQQDVGKGERGFGGRGAITITKIDGSKLSLKTDDGWTRTITVTNDTKLRKGGQEITLTDLEVGDVIRFSQKRNDDGTYTITAIQVPTPKVAGEVTAVSGSTLTLKRRNGETQTVTLDSATQYKVGASDGAKSDVTVGSKVTIQGSVSGSTFTALTVHIQPTVVAGEVTAKTSDSFTLKRRDGSTIVVHVSPDTKYGIRGKAAGGLADIAVGDTAWAAGTTRADGSLDATGVAKGRIKGQHKDKSAKPDGSAAPSTTPG
jgi:hypothetical protein